MGRILMTIAGPWREPPDVDTDLEGAELTFGPADGDIAAEMQALGQRADTLAAEDVSALARHQGLIGFEVEFEGPYKRHAAQAALRFAQAAMAAGGVAVYVETGCKVFGAEAFRPLDARDPALLLHFFVEVLGDGSSIATEGMQAFDLPDISVKYEGDASWAQGAAFSLAAKMICDRFKPAHGGAFRATQSAPLYTVSRSEAVADADDPYTNPLGYWVLEQRA